MHIDTISMDFSIHYFKGLLVIISVNDLSYDVTSGSGITTCNKIDKKTLVVYRFRIATFHMISIITLRKRW